MLLIREIEEIKGFLAQLNIVDKSVSSKPVSWHLNHSLQVINGIIGLMKKSDPANFRWVFNLSRIYILVIGVIPRGKGRAPKSVQVADEVSKAEIETQIEITKKQLLQLEQLHKKNYFEHPYFGKMNKRMTKRFLWIHTEHHLKIVRDILKGTEK